MRAPVDECEFGVGVPGRAGRVKGGPVETGAELANAGAAAPRHHRGGMEEISSSHVRWYRIRRQSSGRGAATGGLRVVGISSIPTRQPSANRISYGTAGDAQPSRVPPLPGAQGGKAQALGRAHRQPHAEVSTPCDATYSIRLSSLISRESVRCTPWPGAGLAAIRQTAARGPRSGFGCAVLAGAGASMCDCISSRGRNPPRRRFAGTVGVPVPLALLVSIQG